MNTLQERKIHGKPDFPFAVYRGKLPEYIPGYPLHWHEEMEIIYIVSGTGCITVQAERCQAEAGDLILIRPQQMHSIDQLNGESMEYFNILFRLSMLDTERTLVLHSGRLGCPCHIKRGQPLHTALLEPVEELIQNRKRVHTDYDLMIRSHLCRIVFQLLQSLPEPEEKQSRTTAGYERLKVILQYLQEHYAEEITVEQAAAMCGFSASHFMKLFRELTGSSFTQYVKNQRLEAAAGQLRSTSKRIGEIAEEQGFHSLPYFTRSFQEKYEVSPGNYRKG